MSKCCNSSTTAEQPSEQQPQKPFDYILYGSAGTIATTVILYLMGAPIPYVDVFAKTALELLGVMWWGIALGIIFVGLMSKIPREYFTAILGKGDTYNGIVRAALAGVLLDLCSHGILMVGAKLYERGASLAQVMTFLIASPWNSLSLTIILIALIGIQWTLLFILGSVVIAIISGVIYKFLVENGTLPPNPHHQEFDESFSVRDDFKERMKTFKPNISFFKEIATGGLTEARMILRWLLLGIVMAAAIRAFVPPDSFSDWFGPTLFGLFMTLLATSVIEVCSEGSAPVAGEILHKAGAPGNAFTFLMAGVATDYTEIMVMRDTTKSWLIALSLPLITVPQVLVIGLIMNLA